MFRKEVKYPVYIKRIPFTVKITYRDEEMEYHGTTHYKVYLRKGRHMDVPEFKKDYYETIVKEGKEDTRDYVSITKEVIEHIEKRLEREIKNNEDATKAKRIFMKWDGR